MIPRASITSWRQKAPWGADAQVEQDLVLSRALVELFRRPLVAENLAFRGGTPITRARFEANIAAKIADRAFLEVVSPLLRTGIAYDPYEAWDRVHESLVTLLPGDPWKGGAKRA